MEIKSRLEAKAESMGIITHKQFLSKRLKFIKWARDERYTLEEIGKVIGLTKEGVYKALLDRKSNVFASSELIPNLVDKSIV